MSVPAGASSIDFPAPIHTSNVPKLSQTIIVAYDYAQTGSLGPSSVYKDINVPFPVKRLLASVNSSYDDDTKSSSPFIVRSDLIPVGDLCGALSRHRGEVVEHHLQNAQISRRVGFSIVDDTGTTIVTPGAGLLLIRLTFYNF